MSHKNSPYLKTTSLDNALARWEQKLTELGLYCAIQGMFVPVHKSLGMVTAAPVSAAISSPFYHASAMDGYAVKFTDTFGASETNPIRLKLGKQAVYVDTGDPMPDTDKNAVIMVEDINLIDDQIEILAPATPWQHVRTVGEDIVETELIAPQSHTIRPVDMGAMLAGGLTKVSVRRPPRVMVIPTGTELVEPGSAALSPGDIIEFSSSVLGGLITEWGGEFLRHDIVPDKRESLREAMRMSASKADLIVVIAGASTGSEDYTESTIKELGELILHGIDIKPGKPGMLGIVDKTPVIGLPGYPVASHLVMNLFGRPLIKKWLGLPDTGYGHGAIKAKLSRQVASSLGHQEFLRVKVGRVGDNLIATPLGRGAGMMMSLVRADGIITIPPKIEGLAAGTMIEVELLRPEAGIENTIVSIGSHDNAMDVLANSLKKRYPHLSLSSAHVGSMGGLMALKRGEAHLAPTHLLDEETGQYNTPFLTRLLPERKVRLINLVHRTQGLMVPRGNPKGIKELADLKRDDITFINRQRGAGTRLLLDKTLNELGISPDEVSGYEREEYTHMGVASAVATGLADTGLGVLSAANALKLDFIPVTKERYDLAIPEDIINSDHIKALLDIIKNDEEFRNTIDVMGGYDLSDMGKTMD